MPDSNTQPTSRHPTAVVSLDVFDTCVARSYHEPTDLLLDLALRTVRHAGLNSTDAQARQLWQQRIDAEKSARRNSGQDDINLDSVYTELERTTTLPVNLAYMRELEPELESASCHPIPTTLQLYKELQGRGGRIIFVSDMYLPRDTVITILRHCGYDANRDNTYVSGDLGYTKASGNLFRHVLEAENIDAGQLSHYGDNRHGDFGVPSELGIQAHLLEPLQAETRYERILLGRDSTLSKLSHQLQQLSRLYRRHYRRPLHELSIDEQISHSRMAAIARLNTADSIPAKQAKLIGSYVAAPLFTAFAFWVIEKAQQQGIQDLYFCARNGQIFQALCEQICKNRKLDIRCSYLYGSRAAWYPASLKGLDEQSIEIIVHNCEGMTIRQIFKALSLPGELIAEIETELGQHFDGLDDETAKEFTQQALSHIATSALHKQFQQHFHQSRQLVLDYFRQLGIGEQPHIGIVDIGWYLSTHNSFQRILKGACDSSVTGFYFGVTRKHQPACTPFEAFISDEGQRGLSWLFKSGAMAIFEEIFSAADHATTIAYRRTVDNVEPLLGLPNRDERSSATLQIQQAMLAFNSTALNCGDEFAPQQALQGALKQFERFYKYPNGAEARSIANTRVDSLADHSTAGKRALCSPVGASGLLAMVRGALIDRKKISPNWTWAQGSLAMSSTPVSVVGRAMAALESLLSRLSRSY